MGNPRDPDSVHHLHITTIDLALSVIIIFLLGAITVRALFFVHDQAELGLFRRSGKRPPDG